MYILRKVNSARCIPSVSMTFELTLKLRQNEVKIFSVATSSYP